MEPRIGRESLAGTEDPGQGVGIPALSFQNGLQGAQISKLESGFPGIIKEYASR